ncbi:MAG: pyridoxal phosphate-dependent decarboxylase family protein [Phototrophicaceae bacterium]
MTLDLSPDEFRRLGHAAIEQLANVLDAHQRPDSPARPPIPADVVNALHHQPLPQDGATAESILERVFSDVLPYPMGNNNPRFFAWVNSTAAPLGILAELLAAAHNPSVAGGNHAATYVEHATLNWLKEFMGYPATAGGLLVSGGSMANLVALGVMRHVKGSDVRQTGMVNQAAPMVIYTSIQGHSCIQKAVEALGFGSAYLRHLPVDANYRMDIAALQAAIAADRAAGLLPVAVAASAGTVSTGAVDPFNAIADICTAENLWFHIDGAYGAVGILADSVRDQYAGLDRADSIALDPHKWMYVPIECGCVLVKDAAAMRAAYSLVPPYLQHDNELAWFSEFGLQQTRGFRALKLWMTIQQLGAAGYQALITRDIDLAHQLAAKVTQHPAFELIAPANLSIVCFRYAPVGATDLDRLNRLLLEAVQADGRVFITGTVINGVQCIRACIVNFRTQPHDLDLLLDVLTELGERLTD